MDFNEWLLANAHDATALSAEERTELQAKWLAHCRALPVEIVLPLPDTGGGQLPPVGFTPPPELMC